MTERKPIGFIEEFEITRMARIHVLAYSPAMPGRISGPPEHCYPPESAEIDAVAEVDGIIIPLTDEELDEVLVQYENQIIDSLLDQPEPDFDDR